MEKLFINPGRLLLFATLLIVAGALGGCKKDKDTAPPILKLALQHHIDGQPLLWDTLIYTNAAGNRYSVERLQYYLSDFRFYAQGREVAFADTVLYVDARRVTELELRNMPYGMLDSVRFVIGLPPAKNLSNSLPPTLENSHMAWPDMMGGGYHFMKLEGRWQDGSLRPGFAMHLGKTGFEVYASAPLGYAVGQSSTNPITLRMNINEWFRNPHNYDFGTDGVYSMGNDTLMGLLRDNGSDVFRP